MTEDEKAIADAKQAGFDLSLIDSNLRLSYEERLLRHDAALAVVQELRMAGAAMYAPTPPAAESAR